LFPPLKNARWLFILSTTLCINALENLEGEVEKELANERYWMFAKEDKPLKSYQRTCLVPHFYLVRILIVKILMVMLIFDLFPLRATCSLEVT
jgi:hypothetical protein